MYAACSRRLAMPSSIASPRSTKCVGCGDPPSATRRRRSPRVTGVGEDPAVAGVTRRVERGQADVPVVGHVEAPATPRLPVVRRHDEVGLVPPDRGREIAPERQPVLHHAVDVTVEELDRLDADHGRAGALLGLPQRSGLGRRHAVDAGFTARDEQVHDLLARRGPAGDGTGRAVLEVVGVGDDAERARPVVREGLQRRAQNDLGDPNTARTRGSKCSSGSVS